MGKNSTGFISTTRPSDIFLIKKYLILRERVRKFYQFRGNLRKSNLAKLGNFMLLYAFIFTMITTLTTFDLLTTVPLNPIRSSCNVDHSFVFETKKKPPLTQSLI
jgi:hypothetical protein